VIDGFLVVDKPSGITSHDVVSILRRTLKQKKIGHTGTLDPFATGVLPIALGEESLKEYQAVMQLGISTDTLDYTGSITAQKDWSHLAPEQVHKVIPRFIGTILQTSLPEKAKRLSVRVGKSLFTLFLLTGSHFRRSLLPFAAHGGHMFVPWRMILVRRLGLAAILPGSAGLQAAVSLWLIRCRLMSSPHLSPTNCWRRDLSV